MKVIYCKECGDLFKLTSKGLRMCKCRNVSGRYRKDGKHAEVSESAVSIKIPNGYIKRAVRRMERLRREEPKSTDKDYKAHSSILAWVRPNFGPGNRRTHRLKKNASLALRQSGCTLDAPS
jgi:hypothetical protein